MNQDFFENIKEAFTRQSLIYDKHESGHDTIKFMRDSVRHHVMNFLKKGDKILELNAGTGSDAGYFAKKGFKVFAIDISGGMVSRLKEKIITNNLSNEITVQQCSFTELNKINSSSFDYIFSNLGGLNCISDLREVTKFFPRLLKKNGKVTLVIMPHICPWEIALLLLGNYKTALRRLKRNGTISHIEGKYFKTFYYTPKEVMNGLGINFKKLKL